MNPCSYRHLDGKELAAVSEEEGLGKMWQQLTDGKLTLCCQVRGLWQASLLGWAQISALPCNLRADFLLQDSDSHAGRPVLYRMLAQHSYLAQGPGDLEFSRGDVLDILSEGSSPVLSAGCAGAGFRSLLQGGTGQQMASPVLSQARTPRRCRLALGFGQT